MAISYWPKHGEYNTERSFATYTDRLMGYADHASADGDFELRYTSTADGNDTWTLSAGHYVFDGYVFTSDGATTVVTASATATDINLYYHLDANDRIDASGIAATANVPAGSKVLKLWNVKNAQVTDYRQLLTWGRQSISSTAVGCVDLLSAAQAYTMSTSATYDVAKALKRFRVAYPGSLRLDVDVKTAIGSGKLAVWRVRGAVGTKLTEFNATTSWASFNTIVTNLMPGDILHLQWTSMGGYVKNARIRYTLSDIPSAQWEKI